MKSPYPITALVCAATLTSCSHATPDAAAATDAPVADRPAAVRTTGTRVDSLYGIPGHPFGSSLATFPGLVAGPSEPRQMKRYYYSSIRPAPGTGWFARHNKDFVVTYFFFNGQFASIVITAYGENRRLLSDEATYLFGLGAGSQPDGTTWRGRQAYATYSNTFTPQGPAASLEIGSQSLAAAQQQQEAARLKADNAPQ